MTPAEVPVIDAVLPLEQAGEAHSRLEGGRIIGKLLLELAGEKQAPASL